MDSPRFELETSCLQGRRSTGLSYKPIIWELYEYKKINIIDNVYDPCVYAMICFAIYTIQGYRINDIEVLKIE